VSGGDGHGDDGRQGTRLPHGAAMSAPAPGTWSTGGAFPPIEDYAMLADGETLALVSGAGGVEWLCAPRMDSPSMFGAILDRDAGQMRLGPHDVRVPSARRYVPGTLVVETTWVTPTGWLVIEDALLVGSWEAAESGEVPPYRRVPRDHRAEHVLVRIARCVHGSVAVTLECDAAPGYGLRRPEWTRTGPGRAETTAGCDPALVLTSDLRLGLEGQTVRARTRLSEGESCFVALSWAGAAPPAALGDAERRLDGTRRFWREWLGGGVFPDHPWRAHLERSALTLKGLIYAPTGAMVAAATTSLPETPGGERNWDYRYTWIRDATFALWGLYTLGLDDEADDFFEWVIDVAGAETDPLHIMYGIDGERELPERTLDHLEGYRGARPVRVGNGAYRQMQHDVWGMLLDSVWLHMADAEHLPDRLWPLVEEQVGQALESWREKDHGIWEVRGAPRHFVSSKVLCWVALDRGARLADKRRETEIAARWREAADEIHADVCANGMDDRGVLLQHYDSDALDASALLAVLMRFLRPDDPRARATVLAIADELSEDGHVLRYRVEETDDGMEGEEGAFVICSFWLVSALAEIGELERARTLCARLLSEAGPLGLFAEQIDPYSRHHLGNYPQAFSHLALINAVVHVIRLEQDLGRTGRFERAGRSRREPPDDV
jgi:alpha,alpha-trehalase